MCYVLQRWARVSMESRYRHLLPSLDWSRSRHPLIFPVSMSLGLDIREISQSRWVSVSTSKKSHTPVESLSKEKPNKRNLTKLDTINHLQHQILTFDGWVSPVREKKSRPTNKKTRIISEISMSLDGVSVSIFFAQSRFWDSDFSSLGLGLVFETQIFQSRSRSRHWDSDLFSLGLGLVIETQTFSVSVSVSMIQIWSRSSLMCYSHFWSANWV